MAQYSFTRLQPEYHRLWETMRVTKVREATAQAQRIINHKARYQAIETTTGVPWFVVGCLHMRESDGNFSTYLGNGQKLTQRTTIKPKGRGPFKTFEEGAVDALHIDGTDKIMDWNPERIAYALETFNGWGYRNPNHNIPSPYLWGGTSVQERGKYVRDGVYSSSTLDPQIGGLAVLRELLDLDSSITFEARDLPRDVPEDQTKGTPKAQDTTESIEKPQVKRKTFWGGVGGFLTTVGTGVAGFFEKLDNPYTLAAFALIILVAAGAFYLVYKGRNDAQALIDHLSEDTEE